MSIEHYIIRILLVPIIIGAVYASFFRGKRDWTNPLFVYVLSMTIIYLFYAISGAKFTNGESIFGEIYYVFNLLLSIAGYIFAVRGADTKSNSRYQVDNDFLSKIHWILLGPMVFSLAILLARLTNGNLLLLFDLSGGNVMKWLRISERDPLVYAVEAIFLSLVSVMIPAAVLSLGQGRKKFIIIPFISYILYLLSTGSRSPAIALILMIVVPIVELNRQGHNNRWVRRTLRLSAIVVASLFIAVTLSRDEIEDNSDSMLKTVFSADNLGFIADSTFIPYGIRLPSTITSIYFSSTFNNYLIAFDQSDVMEKSWGYRLFYTEYKAFDFLFPFGEGNKEQILSDNTEHLRSVSPTGDQWATNLGTLVLEFGLLYSLIASLIQGLVMGWLIRISNELENNRRVILLSLVFTLAVTSSLVHPLMSFSTHIHIVIIGLVAILWISRSRRNRGRAVNCAYRPKQDL